MSANPGGESPTPSLLQALCHGRTLFTLLMFSIFAVMVWIATGYTWPANFLPFIIGIPGMALTLMQVILDVRSYRKASGVIDPRTEFERYMDEVSARTGGKVEMQLKEGTKLQTLVEDPTDLTKSRNKRELILFGYFFLLVFLVLLFGFWIGYPIFMALFLHYYAKESWRLTTQLTIGSWAAMYIVLVIVLEQILFEGHVTKFVIDNWLSD
jgi:hypothetical protein